MGGDFSPEGGNHAQDMGNGIHIHADIDADIVNITRDIVIKQADRCFGIKRQAGMRIPRESGAMA